MLVGTTEDEIEGPPDEVFAQASEAQYLLREVNRVLPRAFVSEQDVIVLTRAFVRWLRRVAAGSRRRPAGILSSKSRGVWYMLWGGKYTTHRLMAQEAVDRVVSRLKTGSSRCQTHETSLWRAGGAPDEYARQVVQSGIVGFDIPERSLSHLALTYGVWHRDVIEIGKSDPRLLQPLCPHHPNIGLSWCTLFGRRWPGASWILVFEGRQLRSAPAMVWMP